MFCSAVVGWLLHDVAKRTTSSVSTSILLVNDDIPVINRGTPNFPSCMNVASDIHREWIHCMCPPPPGKVGPRSTPIPDVQFNSHIMYSWHIINSMRHANASYTLFKQQPRASGFCVDNMTQLNGTSVTPNSRSESCPLKVLVVGAGIGGLTAAIALRKQGHDVHVSVIISPLSKYEWCRLIYVSDIWTIAAGNGDWSCAPSCSERKWNPPTSWDMCRGIRCEYLRESVWSFILRMLFFEHDSNELI